MSAGNPFISKDGSAVTLNELLNSVDAKVDGLPALREEFHALDVDLRGDLANKGQQIAALTSATNQLAALLAEKQGLSVDDIKTALASAIADGIKVTVEVK